MATVKVNKVLYNGTTLIDLTNDTVKAEYVKLGVKFHLPDGSAATGRLIN